MMNISKITKVLSLVLATTAFILVSGNLLDATAQRRDPFAQAPYNRPQQPVRSTKSTPTPSNNGASQGSGNSKPTPPVKLGPQVVPAPAIDARINYYKRVREDAAVNGLPIPKVTSVLLLEEMTVTGVFKTTRGYAAIVEARPIDLSYTIYPGEKFFDGQLVAIEENRLVFRKVTKMSNNKFISSVENKPLRKYTLQQEVQGTTPSNESYEPSTAGQTESADNTKSDSDSKVAAPGVIVSPLEEMRNQPAEEETDSADKNKTRRGKTGKKRASKSKKRP